MTRRRAPFPEWVAAHRTALLVAAAALGVRLAYVYAFTDYPSYLAGDMGAYWTRAFHRFSGRAVGVGEWVIWPAPYHILLAWGMRLADAVGLAGKRLEWVLFWQMAAQSASAGFFFEIAERVLRSHKRALACALVYALCYQLVYMNAFVLPEHGAIPLLISSVWLLFLRRDRPAAGLLASLAAAAAAGLSPRFALYGAALAGYLYLHSESSLSRAKRLLFPAGYALGLAFFAVLALRTSEGKVRGLDARGHEFMLAQCKPDAVTTRHDGTVWVAAPSAFAGGGRGVFETTVPFYEQGFWYRKGWDCIRADPKTLLEGLWAQRNLFYGPVLPRVEGLAGYVPFMAAGSVAVIVLSMVGLLAAPWLWTRRADPRSPELWCLWSLCALTVLTTYLFTAERRYFYPMIFAVTLLAFSALPERRRQRGGRPTGNFGEFSGR